MLTDHEFLVWFQSVHLPDRAKPVIAQIRTSEPSRRVRSTVGNVCGRYPSRKMGRTIQFESHRNELAAILEYEHSKTVLEFWDQPPAIPLTYLSKHGRRLGVCHTPDFFVLHAHGAGWEECKMEEDLQRLTVRAPHRYVRGADGQWRCPPAEQYAAIFGLTYRVRSSAAIHWIYQRNLLFLEDYWRGDPRAGDPQTRTAIQALVAAHPGITLAALLDRAPGTPDDLYQLIAMEDLFVDLHVAPLAEPAWVQVFCDVQTARSLSGPSPMLHEVLKEVSTVGNAAARDRLAQASPADLERALHRYTVIRPCLDGAPCGDRTLPARTLSRWLALYRAAEASYGAGLLGLIPRHQARGNRTPRVPEPTRLLMHDYIHQYYETLKQPRIHAVYGAFVRACDARGLAPPTYATFCTYVRRQPRAEQIRKRQGARAAMPLQPCYLELTLSTPRHGDRPFEICHIDHTELDIELVCSRTGRNLGRPWATFLSDAFSRRLLAVFLTYDAPSYRSCMMVIRECVRRHGRLPQSIIIDGGREFDSVYFDLLLARYECIKKTRPPAQPRFGSVCERLFGVANTQFIHTLAGNTQLTKQVRLTTKAVDPKRHAVWTLAALYARLCEWAYDVHDTLDHPALGQSPRDAWATAMRTSGERPQRAVAYDEEFWLWTLPTTVRGTARVVPGRGVKVNYIFYWSSAFRDPAVEHTLVPVRYDPYNAGTAFAYVGTRWVECLSEHYASLRGRSEREVMVASVELRKRAQTHARQGALTARRLADFLASVEAEEILQAQRLRDREAHNVVRLIDGTINTLPPEGRRDASDATPRPHASSPPTASVPTLPPEHLHVYEEY